MTLTTLPVKFKSLCLKNRCFSKKTVCIALLFMILASLSAYAILIKVNNEICGIEVVSKSAILQYSEVQAGTDGEFCLLFNGAAAPYDAYDNTYYISQDINQIAWQGILRPSDSSYQLYFVNNGLDNKKEAISSGSTFTLLDKKMII